MKMIIAGSREFIGLDDDYVHQFVFDILDRDWGNNLPDIVVSGKAGGIDTIGEKWAEKHGIKVLPFKPKYARFGPKIAPMKRNTEMAEVADMAVIFWNGYSTGSMDMKDKMKDRGKAVWLFTIK